MAASQPSSSSSDTLESRLKFGWFGVDLPCRPCRSTYELYTQIPPIPISKSQDLFQFLDPTLPPLPTYPHLAPLNLQNFQHPNTQPSADVLTKLDTLRSQYPTLPGEFLVFMSNKRLQDRIPSCTANYFYLGNPLPLSPETDILLFYRDQQDCVAWYLVLSGPLAGCVLGSPVVVGTGEEGEEWGDGWEEVMVEDGVVCAMGFLEFLYRVWVENHVWFRGEGEGVLEVGEEGGVVERECEWYLEECRKLEEEQKRKKKKEEEEGSVHR
ncbi:hypothetical protein HDV05_005643 [Chytridiales sp. JEL 0842]|nr:hypothetical protein HDV05_005643 [Chytridiales sp. JEL 0842]